MGFSYFKSKLSVLLSCGRLCSTNLRTSSHHHHGGLVKKFKDGFTVQILNRPTTSSNVGLFSSFLFLYGTKSLLFRRFYHGIGNRIPLEKSLSLLPWIRSPKYFKFGSLVLIAVLFGRVQKIPYSNRYHLAPSGTLMERKISDLKLERMEREYEGKILPPTSKQSTLVQGIVSNIVEAMHRDLKLQKQCSVVVHDPKAAWSTSPAKTETVVVGDLRGESERNWMRNFGRRVSTKHLEGLNWRVMVVDSHYQVNACYLPNGTIVVFTGLLMYLETEAELATILAHEVAHGIARHSSEMLLRIICVLALLSLHFLTVPLLLFLYEYFISARKREFEADYIGLMLMAAAGYDPRTALEVYELVGGEDKFSLLETHPSGTKRVKKLNRANVMEQAVAIYMEAEQS